MAASSLDTLRTRLDALLDRAYVPFSGTPAAAAVLLRDGSWVPGVRIESASFSLTIPALLNAYTTLVPAGRTDVVAVVQSRPFRPEEIAYLEGLPLPAGERLGTDAWIVGGAEQDGSIPPPTSLFDPTLPTRIERPEQGIACVREVAQHAYVPESAFPVGALLETADGSLFPGVNVEHPDWARILCAERCALGTAWSYGHREVSRLFLTCLKDKQGTPCGACRQILAELTPKMTLWMDRHDDEGDTATPSELLPGSFRGDALLS